MTEQLRKVIEKDLPLIRKWRNHSKVQRFMFTQHEVLEGEHQQWFQGAQTSSVKLLYIYEANNIASGFLQLQKKSAESGVYEWGFYINPEAVSGTGTKMARLALNMVFNEMGGQKIFGEVLAFNLPSIKLHQKLGFIQEGTLRQQHFSNGQYHNVHCFGLLNSEWQKGLEDTVSLGVKHVKK